MKTGWMDSWVPPVSPGATNAALRGSWYEIDLGAVRHNFRQLKACLPPSVKVYACLKRNGYGCGAARMADILASQGAHGFAVASLLDAISIRNFGIDLPVLLYPGAASAAGPMIEALNLTISVSSVAELDQWRKTMKTIHAFIKVDLGFFRAGATPRDAVDLLERAFACPDVHVEGLYAHMSELPVSRPTDAADQLARMHAIVNEATARNVRPAIIMMSSTQGVLSYPEMDFDAVDPGALLVGVPETDNPVRHMSLRPALKTIATSLAAVKRLDASLGMIPEGLGFHEEMILGVIGFGWGDGFPRDVPRLAEALVGGKRVPILAPAHLEHLRLDLTNVPGARPGDPVILLGQQGRENLSLEEVAATWGTDPVGLYASLRDHIPRIYT